MSHFVSGIMSPLPADKYGVKSSYCDDSVLQGPTAPLQCYDAFNLYNRNASRLSALEVITVVRRGFIVNYNAFSAVTVVGFSISVSGL